MEGESEVRGARLAEKRQQKAKTHILYNIISLQFNFLSFVCGVAETAASKALRAENSDPSLTCYHKVSWPQSPHYGLDFEEQ